MSPDFTSQLQGLIDRLAAGDLSARDELIGRAYDRLRRLARKMLRKFPHVGGFEDSSDVLHDSLPRLIRALEAVPPASVAQLVLFMSRELSFVRTASKIPDLSGMDCEQRLGSKPESFKSLYSLTNSSDSSDPRHSGAMPVIGGCLAAVT